MAKACFGRPKTIILLKEYLLLFEITPRKSFASEY